MSVDIIYDVLNMYYERSNFLIKLFVIKKTRIVIKICGHMSSSSKLLCSELFNADKRLPKVNYRIFIIYIKCK